MAIAGAETSVPAPKSLSVPELDISDIEEVYNPETDQFEPVDSLELVEIKQPYREEKVWKIQVHPGNFCAASLRGHLKKEARKGESKGTYIFPMSSGGDAVITATHLW